MKNRLRSPWPAGLPALLIIIAALIAGCSTPDDVAPPDGGNGTAPTGLIELERAAHELVNQHRQSSGLAPLIPDERITVQARRHSTAMAASRVPFGHDGFAARLAAVGIPYSAAAENVAMNYGYADPAAAAVRGWLESPGHRANIEGGFDLTGIGAAKDGLGACYFTQIFIRSR